MRQFKYLDALTTAFVVILLVSNLVAQKLVRIGPIPLGAGWHIPAFTTSGAMVLFPVTYIFADVFTEVYGYGASRRAIWLGFFGTALMYGVSSLVIWLPADPAFKNQQAFQAVFGFLPRILIASLIAYWMGEFANSFTLAKLKLLTDGKMLWTRTIGSTIVGQAVDTTLVVVLTFAGTASAATLAQIIVVGWLLKVAYETAATPLTYVVVNGLKRAEKSDAFDRGTDFNPFRFGSQNKNVG